MSSAEFEPASPIIKGLQTYALDHMATRIGFSLLYSILNIIKNVVVTRQAIYL